MTFFQTVSTYLNKKGERDDWSAIYCKNEAGNSIQGRPVKNGTDVVMCLVNPYEHLREELANNNQDKVVEIYLCSERDLRKEYHVEVGKLMTSELISLGLLDKSDIQNQDHKNPAYKKYFMHGTSHHMGLDTHDYGDLKTPMVAKDLESIFLTSPEVIFIIE